MSYQPPKFRKLAKPRACLVIGNIQLGFDESILKTLSVVAEEYQAEVFHLGNVCTDDEKRMYERRINKIRTFEKAKEEQETKLHKAIARAKYLEDVEKLNAQLRNHDIRSEQEAKRLKKEVDILVDAEKYRVEVLLKWFPSLKFIANKEQYLIKNHIKKQLIGGELELSKHITLRSVSANGSKTSNQPITDRAFHYLKTLKSSAIVPHPTPALRSYHREGLNKAWNMYTTGCLFNQDAPNRPSEFFKAVHRPSALLVFIDKESGEFHDRRLNFDTVPCLFGKRPKPAILEDGRVFTGGGYWEVEGANMAVYSTDDHAPFEHRGVLAATRTLVYLTKAETFINGGDAADWHSLCPHNEGKPLYAEGLRFVDDEKAFTRLLNAQADAPWVKTRRLIHANHENWKQRMVARFPFLMGFMDPETVYRRAIPDWDWFVPKGGSDFTYKFMDIPVHHGDKVLKLSTALKVYGEKSIKGHDHSREELLGAASCGAAAGLGPAFLEGSITKWQNCNATFTGYSGVARYSIKSILHDERKKVSRFCYRGDIYEVAWHEYEV